MTSGIRSASGVVTSCAAAAWPRAGVTTSAAASNLVNTGAFIISSPPGFVASGRTGASRQPPRRLRRLLRPDRHRRGLHRADRRWSGRRSPAAGDRAARRTVALPHRDGGGGGTARCPSPAERTSRTGPYIILHNEQPWGMKRVEK